jgi:hypothetical protein
LYLSFHYREGAISNRHNLKPYLAALGDCSSFEVLIQCNWMESRVITGEALPLPLKLGPAILWFQIFNN